MVPTTHRAWLFADRDICVNICSNLKSHILIYPRGKQNVVGLGLHLLSETRDDVAGEEKTCKIRE